MFTGPKQVTTLSHACLARRAPAPTPWPCAHPHALPLVPRPQLTLCSWRGHICAAASLASAVTACFEPPWPVPTRLHPRAHSSPPPPARRTSAPRPGRSLSSAAPALALSLHPSLLPLLPLLLTSCPSLCRLPARLPSWCALTPPAVLPVARLAHLGQRTCRWRDWLQARCGRTRQGALGRRGRGRGGGGGVFLAAWLDRRRVDSGCGARGRCWRSPIALCSFFVDGGR